MITVAKVLRKAREILKRDGWTQHKFAEGPTGPVCALGAVNRALFEFAKEDDEVADVAIYTDEGDFYIDSDDFTADLDNLDELASAWDSVRFQAEQILTKEIEKDTGGLFASVPSFNDAPKTTFSKVLAIFGSALTKVKGA